MDKTLQELIRILSETIKRIDTYINFYYDKNHFEVTETFQNHIYKKLVRAYEYGGRILCIKKNSKLFHSDDNKIEIRSEIISFLNYIEEILNLLYTCYDVELAKKVKSVLIHIKNTNRYMDIYDIETVQIIDEYIERTDCISYFKGHEEYTKLEGLLEIGKEFLSEVNNISLTSKSDYIRIISILKKLEKELPIINNLDDQYLKSAYLYFFKQNIGEKMTDINTKMHF